jgi:hypothetical protein
MSGGLDSNCDDVDGVDGDGDGFAAWTEDCEDDNASIHPGAVELCDGVDQDCDGVPSALAGGDEVDDDGDGFLACAECDDASDLRYPGAVELCDGLDTDCDGALAPGDEDGDGDGDLACDDCDDGDPTMTTLDADGDGETSCATDCDDDDPVMNTADLDADGFTPCGGDCSDYNPAVSPGGTEVCNGLDDDCDDALPDWDQDLDGDGFIGCLDCDDDDPAISPAGLEVCNALDDDCDGVLPGDEYDHDGDGWLACDPWVGSDPAISGGGDCNPAEPTVWPGAPDGCDNLDNDCNGVVDDTTDLDGDGFCDGDCDDVDPDIWPGNWADAEPNAEWDGVDWNCDGDDAFTTAGASIAITGPRYTGEELLGDADIDGDGAADLLFSSDGGMHLFLSLSAGATLATTDADAVYPASRAVSLGDLDADGRDEVAMISSVGVRMFSGWSLAQLPADLTSADLTLEAAPSEGFGARLLAADLDGDGILDLAVSATYADDLATDAGKVYGYSGAWLADRLTAAGGPFSYDTSYASWTIAGATANAHFGHRLGDGGDVDGDGVRDLLVSIEDFVAGAVSVFSGASLAPGAAEDTAITHILDTGAELDFGGGGLLGLGDLDSDGLGEVFVSWHPGVGAIFSGSQLATNETLTAGAADLVLIGGFGYLKQPPVRCDLDGDGVDEVLFGDRVYGTVFATSTSNLGAALVAGSPYFDLETAGWAFSEGVENDETGWAVACADFNFDGLPDLVATAPSANYRVGNGAVYVILNGL